jgi:2-dehydropantoate 2-reductase
LRMGDCHADSSYGRWQHWRILWRHAVPGGNQVTLIARGPHLKAIRDGGLRIITDEEELVVHCDATDDPNEVGPVDLALLTVKTYHNEQAVPAMLPMIGENTTILCLQNGIDSYQTVAKVVGNEKVMPGAAYIEGSLPGPGVVRQTGRVVRIAFGELNGGDSEWGRRILETLEGSEIPAEFNRDIQKTLWNKFLFIATMAGVTTLSRQTMAELMPRTEWRRVIIGCMREIEATGRASGVNLDPQIVDSTIQYIEGSLEQMHASMHADIMAGRPLELEPLNGALVRAGEAVNVPTPINNVIYAMLKPYAKGQTGK